MTVDLAGIAALIVAAVTLWKVFRMTSKEVNQADADASEKYASASSKTAELNEGLQTKIEIHTAKIETLECQVGAQGSEIKVLHLKLAKRDTLLKEWQKGIDLLIKQLIDADQTPVWKPDTIVEDIDKE